MNRTNKYYTVTFKTNLLKPLYLDRRYMATYEPNLRVAVDEELIKKFEHKYVKSFLAKTFKVDNEKLTLEIIKEEADMTLFTKELKKHERLLYVIPNPEQDKREEIENLESDIQNLEEEIKNLESDIEELESKKDDAEYELRDKRKKLEEALK